MFNSHRLDTMDISVILSVMAGRTDSIIQMMLKAQLQVANFKQSINVVEISGEQIMMSRFAVLYKFLMFRPYPLNSRQQRRQPSNIEAVGPLPTLVKLQN